MASARFRTKLIAGIAALIGMVALPAACIALRYSGPASRIVWFDYLPVEELVLTLAAAAVGLSLGLWIPRLFERDSTPRWPVFRLSALGLLLGWILLVQLRAFPASASADARAAWAHARIPQYAALTRVIAALPEVQRDVGRIVVVAPTARDQHRSAREMNGDDMSFALDVIGERGRGVFYADCTLDEARVYDWRSGRWRFNGREQRITHVPDRVPTR